MTAPISLPRIIILGVVVGAAFALLYVLPSFVGIVVDYTSNPAGRATEYLLNALAAGAGWSVFLIAIGIAIGVVCGVISGLLARLLPAGLSRRSQHLLAAVIVCLVTAVEVGASTMLMPVAGWAPIILTALTAIAAGGIVIAAFPLLTKRQS